MQRRTDCWRGRNLLQVCCSTHTSAQYRPGIDRRPWGECLLFGIKLILQKMSIGQKRSLLVKKQVDMAIYDFRPFVPDIGYYLYWNWLPDSLNNYWGYINPEAQSLGNEAITLAVDSPERHAKLQRFQEIINGDVGTIPLFSEFDNAVMREHVQGYVSYPDGIAMLSKLSIA
jgi:ABC-type transport system substrate-binding protein